MLSCSAIQNGNNLRFGKKANKYSSINPLEVKLEEFQRPVKPAFTSFHFQTIYSYKPFKTSMNQSYLSIGPKEFIDEKITLVVLKIKFISHAAVFLPGQWLKLKDVLLSLHLKMGGGGGCVSSVNIIGVNFFYSLSKLNMRLMPGSEWQCLLKIRKTQGLITCKPVGAWSLLKHEIWSSSVADLQNI